MVVVEFLLTTFSFNDNNSDIFLPFLGAILITQVQLVFNFLLEFLNTHIPLTRKYVSRLISKVFVKTDLLVCCL